MSSCFLVHWAFVYTYICLCISCSLLCLGLSVLCLLLSGDIYIGICAFVAYDDLIEVIFSQWWPMMSHTHWPWRTMMSIFAHVYRVLYIRNHSEVVGCICTLISMKLFRLSYLLDLGPHGDMLYEFLIPYPHRNDGTRN